jgi:hypothetical protein
MTEISPEIIAEKGAWHDRMFKSTLWDPTVVSNFFTSLQRLVLAGKVPSWGRVSRR